MFFGSWKSGDMDWGHLAARFTKLEAWLWKRDASTPYNQCSNLKIILLFFTQSGQLVRQYGIKASSVGRWRFSPPQANSLEILKIPEG